MLSVPDHSEKIERSIKPWDWFISCDCGPRPYDPTDQNHAQGDRAFTHPSLCHIYHVRLVSRDWNAGASRILRRYCWWPIDLDSSDNLKRALGLWGQRPGHMSASSSNSALIRNLNITLISHVRPSIREYYVDDAMNKGEDPLSIYCDCREEDAKGSLLRVPDVSDTSAANGMFRELIVNLTAVEAFSVAFPRAPSCHHGDIVYEAKSYDTDQLIAALDTIIFALRSPAFRYLTDLRLALPDIRDIGNVAAAIPPQVKQHLKHLYIEIVDQTGPSGSVENSNLQAQYPNRDHQDEVWQFIASCNNLESLGLHCTHYLRLDRLFWQPGPNTKGLRSLYLNRVHANISTLANLLTKRPNKADPPVVRRVDLQRVKIYEDGGDWSTLFNLLAKCPELDFLSVCNVGYCALHPHFFFIPMPFDFKTNIWSDNEADQSSFMAVLEKLANRVGGLSHYPVDLGALNHDALMIAV
ncbi:hypothetical protein SAMD00023353_0402130 [Rosellinia necatrix]|uniref:Uncharacterized protein n=1 Tax=Rosellinia necatrix TaxID=77044 RepID=A0A1S7UIX3_ROSNE|nr:hypothetical protein SAMD00023353_0402130 [Rosellinia necatrix]